MHRPFAVLIAILASTATVSGDAAATPPGTAGHGEQVLTIRVINDLNENGTRDDGEPGLEDWQISLICGDALSFQGRTGPEGELVYRHAQPRECVNVYVEFGWLPTTPTRVVVDIPAGGEAEVVFLVRWVGEDVHLLNGLAIADGLPADPGGRLDALVDGVSCGDGILAERYGLIRYELYVLGGGVRPDCAQEHEEVVLTYDGREAGTTAFSSGHRQQLDLIAGPIPMYFSFWFYPYNAGTAVPYIGSMPCGRAYLETVPLPPPNLQTVFVVSAETQEGCGTPGRAVSLMLGDEVLRQVVWQEGRVAKDRLQQPGDANCDQMADAVDAALVLQHGAGLLDELQCRDAANVTGDGRIDAIDAALILQHAAGLFTYFP